MAVITFSRQFGAGGNLVASTMAQKLGFLLINREIITSKLEELGLPPQLTHFDKTEKKTVERDKKRQFYLTALHDYIMDLADKQSIILLGRGGQLLFRNHPNAFHIRIQAPFEMRVERVQEIYRLEQKAAFRLVQERDRSKKRYIREVFCHSWMDIELFDLVLNTGKLTHEDAAEISLQAYSRFQIELEKKCQTKPEAEIPVCIEPPTEKFMHASEAEFAHVLDYYNIRWQYEPRTFPLQWSKEGNVTEAFAPDFYLPDYDLYIELTTQRQKLVWKKNKKIRRLKELHPEINIKIFYGKDYQSLLKKYGLDK